MKNNEKWKIENGKSFPFRSYVPLSPFRLFFEVLLRQRIFLVFSLPEYSDDPPTLAVIHQLHAVNSTLKRFRVVRTVARFVGAENVSNVAKHFRLPRCLLFVKAFLLKKGLLLSI